MVSSGVSRGRWLGPIHLAKDTFFEDKAMDGLNNSNRDVLLPPSSSSFWF
jgi:hypothetical protein